ncbi:hypothetical protein MCC93_14240 [Morococcus cerebrosus]|uniref:Uncharacterized protein n=1 Tax=Morococcus cerebrosus TaxID=1056807 RepID=A0A0C1E5P8_9NEIS|nr:hypothetical protein [Neisseria sicca]KIC07374.1 hypothetical protein MCC93_14240 [Morococcus cerebrosus]
MKGRLKPNYTGFRRPFSLLVAKYCGKELFNSDLLHGSCFGEFYLFDLYVFESRC